MLMCTVDSVTVSYAAHRPPSFCIVESVLTVAEVGVCHRESTSELLCRGRSLSAVEAERGGVGYLV